MESKDKEELYEQRSQIKILTAQVDALQLIITTLVTRPEFTPVKLIVYGLVGSLLAGVVGALLSKILTK